MARSSGPGAHPGGLPPQRQQPGAQAPAAGWPQQQDPQAWPPQQAAAGANGWPTQGHYAQQPGYAQQPAAPAADPLARGGEYHYPQTQQPHAQQAAQADPYVQQRAAAAAPRTAPPAAQQPQYAPQFDAYVPTTRPTAPPTQRPAHPLQQALQAGAAGQQLRGTTQEHWPAPAAAPQPHAYQQQAYQPQPADPRGYDLGHYSPAAQQPAQGGYEPALARTYTQPGQQQDWGQQHAAHAASGYAPDPHAHYAQAGMAQQPSLDPSGYHNDQQGGYETGQELTAGQEYDQDDTEYEEEEPRRRSKGLIIVAALVGAIGLGGGLAYAYKTFLGPADKGKVPVVKNDRAPAKVAPVTPGGKQFANAEAKVLNNADGNKISGRLGDSGSSGTSAGAADADGVRRVQTMTVDRTGAVSPAPALPGVILDTPRPAPPQQAQQPAPPPQQQAAASPPPAPVVKNIIAQPSRPEPAAAPPPPAARAAPPPPAVVSAQQAAAATSVSPKQPVPRAATAGSVSPGVGSGHVAVLSLLRTEADAPKVFAGLKQKYPDLLQNRQPGVQEATHPEKGVVHRLLAAPAGAKQDADALCMQLKASGHAGCWVTVVK